MPSAARKRAREQFLASCETGEGHPYHGCTPAEILDFEKKRHPVPNRAALRKHGARSGYTKRLHFVLGMALEERRIDRREDTAAMQAARKAAAA